MKAMPTGHTPYDYSKLEETEFALAISPCPRIEESKDKGEDTHFARKRSGLDRRRQAERSRHFDDNDLTETETLTIGWAIALAIAVAAVIHVSGV